MRRNLVGVFGVGLVLLATRQALGQEPASLRGRLAEVARRQEEASGRYGRELRAGTTEAAREIAVGRYLAEVGRNTEEVLEAVREAPRDPAVVEALKFVIVTARGEPGDQSERAMEILLRDHVGDPGMGDVSGRIFAFWQSARAEALVRAVLDRHPGRVDRGLACHSLAYTLTTRANLIRRIRRGYTTVEDHVAESSVEATRRLVREADLDALGREAEGLLERVIAEYSDVKDWFDPRRTLGSIAEGELFALRNLAEGKVAPEIAGKDHEGKPFALGDYRGKVVVLTFSASWCGPCVAMYPQERELVRKWAGQPFAMVSVNADGDVETLRGAIAAGDVTWRCWWDGGLGGPITTRWGVSAIPEVFVLDPKGVIRYKDVRGDDLEKAVASLMAEVAKGRE